MIAYYKKHEEVLLGFLTLLVISLFTQSIHGFLPTVYHGASTLAGVILVFYLLFTGSNTSKSRWILFAMLAALVGLAGYSILTILISACMICLAMCCSKFFHLDQLDKWYNYIFVLQIFGVIIGLITKNNIILLCGCMAQFLTMSAIYWIKYQSDQNTVQCGRVIASSFFFATLTIANMLQTTPLGTH
jgi:hypothetical protein